MIKDNLERHNLLPQFITINTTLYNCLKPVLTIYSSKLERRKQFFNKSTDSARNCTSMCHACNCDNIRI